MDILEPGGDLIIASECAEGMGSPEYAEAQRRLMGLGVDGFMADISAKPQASVDEWQTQMLVKPMRAGQVYLYSDRLSAADQALTGVTPIDSVEAAIADSIGRHGDRDVAFIPEGPYVVPFHDR